MIRVILRGDGATVSFEVDTVPEAVELVEKMPARLLNGARAGVSSVSVRDYVEPAKPRPKSKRKPRRRSHAPMRPSQAAEISSAMAESLSPALQEVWTWLAANDTPEGHTAIELAPLFGATVPAMAVRVRQLVKRGVIHRVSRGHYRAGEELRK